MADFYQLMSGPRLFRIFGESSVPGRDYEPSLVELGADKIIFFFSFTYWMSPLLLVILFRRGHFTTEGVINSGKFVLCVGTLYYTVMLVRGIFRFMNPDYMAFTAALLNAQKVLNEQNSRALAKYDFEYWASPVHWKWSDVDSGEVKRKKLYSTSRQDPPRLSTTLQNDILSYICAHTFCPRLAYPGSISFVSTLYEGRLRRGRVGLVEEKHGKRAKLLTEDGNEIDTMFIDRRGTQSFNGKTLVVTCEGNAGFYEVGVMETPLDLDYSVIGWNHPGFAGSSGVPFPSQEQNAIDAVMQYSINKLGFSPDNIVLYGWSIGGYTASWAAMNYPSVKYVILDATFDDVLPLALAVMPIFPSSLVETTVNRYLNLDIASQLVHYPGPVLLIRRISDEVMTSGDPTAIHENRSNFLLKKLLEYRYPNIVDSCTFPLLDLWLQNDMQGQYLLWSSFDVDVDWCTIALRSYMEEREQRTFPWDIGSDYNKQQKSHMTLFLASKYMEDFDSTHNTHLQTAYFKKPWTPLR